MILLVYIEFLRRLRCIFAVTILWSRDSPSKDKYAAQIPSAINAVHISEDVIYMCIRIIDVSADP